MLSRKDKQTYLPTLILRSGACQGSDVAANTSLHPRKYCVQSALLRRSRSALLNPADRLFIMVVVWCHQSRPPRSVRAPQCCPTTCADNEQMGPELSELNDLLGRIERSALRCAIFIRPPSRLRSAHKFYAISWRGLEHPL